MEFTNSYSGLFCAKYERVTDNLQLVECQRFVKLILKKAPFHRKKTHGYRLQLNGSYTVTE